MIPGHEQSGEELIADELRVDDGPLRFEFRGNCGYCGAASTTSGNCLARLTSSSSTPLRQGVEPGSTPD